MFVGHYAASFVAKAYEPRASLAALFIAAQFLDLIFFPLVLLNVEQLAVSSVADELTSSGHLILPYMPYSHSLCAALIWTLIGFFICKSVLKLSRTESLLIALVIASHWLLDLVSHTPDLAVHDIFSDDAIKWGLGLNNFTNLSFAVEIAVLSGAVYLYLRRSESISSLGHICTPLILLIMVGLNTLNTFSEPLSTNASTISIQACALFIALAAVATLVDRSRQGR